MNRLRSTPFIRSPIIWCRSISRRRELPTNRLIVVMYHDMRASAHDAFIRQLDYMRSLGKFISATQAVEVLENKAPINGLYFCVTFDDGERTAYDHAFPLLAERNIPGALFVVPSWVSSAAHQPETPNRKYINWQECRKLARTGFTIGSHSLSHRRLSTLNPSQAKDEMLLSKIRLERELNQRCEHFACPWGQPGDDYIADRDPPIAARAGYRSFFTTIRGGAGHGVSPWAIPRIRLEPDWGIYQLRYLFSR